jgi:hypothetical protein
MGCGRSEVSWLGLRAAPSRGTAEPPVAPCDASTPVHSGGTAPASHRTSLDHRPNERLHPTRADGQTRRPPLQSRVGAPPSSRGLGRRPLTAETGVRIPVAVPHEPCSVSGFLPSGFRRFLVRRDHQSRHRVTRAGSLPDSHERNSPPDCSHGRQATCRPGGSRGRAGRGARRRPRKRRGGSRRRRVQGRCLCRQGEARRGAQEVQEQADQGKAPGRPEEGEGRLQEREAEGGGQARQGP